MINFATITKAVETLLNANLTGYTIERNPQRNTDPNLAARGSGWIGVYRGKVDYTPEGGMGPTPWLARITPKVEVQRASMQSGKEAEDRLEAAVAEVMAVLTADKKLGGTVDQTNGYGVEYEYNEKERTWHHAAIITIRAEVRTG